MKSILSAFLVICCLLWCSLSFCQDLRGPKILGLQLGMPVNEGVEIVNQLCSKLDMKAAINPEMKQYYGCSTPNNLIPFVWISGNNNVVSSIKLSHQIFGHNFDKDFLQLLINKYNIPELTSNKDKYGINHYTYKDASSGWQLHIAPRRDMSDFELTEIKKMDSSIFE